MSKVLFVDDEVLILESMTALFEQAGYEFLTARSGLEALDILEKTSVDLIFCDMRMPNMDGYQLLSMVKYGHPRALRVLIGGHGDERQIFRALQQNIAKIYVYKPWNNDLLLRLTRQLLDTERILLDEDLLLMMNSFEDLPTIRSSYDRILDMIESDSDIADIAAEIERDQSISGQILHIANSAYYGVKTGSVRQAISFLGLQNIKNITLSTSIMDAFSMNSAGREYAEKLWEHAFLTNRIVLYIYDRVLMKRVPELAYSAGLLHNIGVVFLLKCFANNYMYLTEKVDAKGLNLLELEQAEFHVNHQQTGGYLVHWWELPFPIVEGALFHHEPLDARIVNTELVAIIHIAQKYATQKMGMPQETPFYTEVYDILQTSQQKVEQEMAQFPMAR